MRIFISEDTIDATVVALENADFEEEVEIFGEEYPAVLSYIFSEDFELLTQAERDLMLYLALVIVRAVERGGKVIPPLSTTRLSEAEELNWEKLDAVTSKRFRDRLDVFFKDTEQEDLLAFVEDSLVEDEEEEVVTKEGREPLFVALKSLIDVIA